jgi:hypothetical protein
MDLFNIKQRKTMSFEEWMRNRKVAETPKHMEKGEAEITKDGMDGGEKGKAGYVNAMDDDHAGLEKGKHDATKATYSGASTAATSYDKPMDDAEKINIKK